MAKRKRKPESIFSGQIRDCILIKFKPAVYVRVGSSIPSSVTRVGGGGFLSLGTKGALDALFIRNGFVHLVELKVGYNKLRPTQEEFLDKCSIDGRKDGWVITKRELASGTRWYVWNYRYDETEIFTTSLVDALSLIFAEDPKDENHCKYQELINRRPI